MATWATAGIGLVATSCSFLFELDANQCSVAADCEKFGGDLPVCAAGLCVAEVDTGGNGGSATAGTAGAAPPDAGAGGVGETGCKSNKECIDANFGQPFVCQAGECIDLVTDECPLVLGEENIKAEAPIILGAYTLANATDKSVASRNIELALSEFDVEVIGLPGGPNRTKRPLAFVVCNSSFPDAAPGSIEPFEPSLTHLVDRLRVPGILSGLSARDMQAVFAQKLADAGTFVISPYEQDSELARFSDGGRLWHLLGATSDLAATYGPLLKRTEQYLIDTAFLNLGADNKLRVAIVTANIARETDVRDALQKLSELEDFNYELFDIKSALLTETPNTAEVGSALLEYAPNIIVALAGSEFIDGVIPILEGGNTWGAMGTPTYDQSRPFYVLGAAMAPETWFLYSTMVGAPGGYNTLLDRIVGVTYESAQDTTLLVTYAARLLGANRDLPDPSILVGSENVYDAAYLLIYAAAAVSGAVPKLDGQAMASGMVQLLEGEAYDVGPEHINAVINTVEGGGDVGLRLTMGEPDWNKARGTRNGRGSVYCLNDKNAAGNENDPADEENFPRGPNNDVLRYNPETNTLENDLPGHALPCIPNF